MAKSFFLHFLALFSGLLLSLLLLHAKDIDSYGNNRILDLSKISQLVVVQDMSAGFLARQPVDPLELKPIPPQALGKPVCVRLWMGKYRAQKDDAIIRISLVTPSLRDHVDIRADEIADKVQRFCFERFTGASLQQGEVFIEIEGVDAPKGQGPNLVLGPMNDALPITINGVTTENTLPYSFEVHSGPSTRQILVSVLLIFLVALIAALALAPSPQPHPDAE